MEKEGIEIMVENIQNKNFIRKISSVTEEHNTIYSRKVELSMWIGLIWFWVFGSQGI
jgi:hypothetical protein